MSNKTAFSVVQYDKLCIISLRLRQRPTLIVTAVGARFSLAFIINIRLKRMKNSYNKVKSMLGDPIFFLK